MSKSFKTDPVIVIIATSYARTNLLFERSLRSVYEQSNINPHQVYIIDDNPIEEGEKYSNEYAKIKSVIRDLREEILEPKLELIRKQKNNNDIVLENFFHTTLLKNIRTKGFSGTGAWNTGAFKALNYTDRNYYLAFLDDDDEWKSSFLEKSYKSVKQTEKRIINGKLKNIRSIVSVAGFNRIEDNGEVIIQANSENFTRENFFIGNPGLQGSNLFIELKTFWAIGGFDESLKSATDRDLAIRLIDYVRIRSKRKIVFVDEILINHYASSKNRITSIPENKKLGLDTFYRKYLHQFPDDIKQKSLARAQTFFNYRIASKKSSPVKHIEQINNIEGASPINLIIGTISDNAQNLTSLLKSFLYQIGHFGESLIDYRFIVLENISDEYVVRPVIDYFSTQKRLKVQLLKNVSNGRSIGDNRTYLQNKVYEIGKEKFGNEFVSWIIDDDHLFEFDSKYGVEIPNYFEIISKKSNARMDAMFGLSSDAAPLPFLNTLRVQLIDMYYNLTYLASCKPEDEFVLSNLQIHENEQKEFYYDLAENNFQHLEYPYYCKMKGVSCKEALLQLLNESALLSKGVNVYRKLTYDPQMIGKVTKESIYRGGNTIIYNPELLKIPNFTPDTSYNRRSDFNWAIINSTVFNKKLYEVVLPLKHYRRLQKTSIITNEKKLKADIKGLIFYRFFKKVLSVDNWESKKEHKNELKYYSEIKRNSFLRIKINNYRIQTLINLILFMLKDRDMWWNDDKYIVDTNYLIQQNVLTMEVLRIELGRRKFQKFLENLELDMKIDNDFVIRIKNDVKSIKNE